MSCQKHVLQACPAKSMFCQKHAMPRALHTKSMPYMKHVTPKALYAKIKLQSLALSAKKIWKNPNWSCFKWRLQSGHEVLCSCRDMDCLSLPSANCCLFWKGPNLVSWSGRFHYQGEECQWILMNIHHDSHERCLDPFPSFISIDHVYDKSNSINFHAVSLFEENHITFRTADLCM